MPGPDPHDPDRAATGPAADQSPVSGAHVSSASEQTTPYHALPVQAEDVRPPTIPGYEIVGVLGHGGMGVVYLARQLSLNRTVALKVVLGGGHAPGPERVRFMQEAEAGAALNHPNVVRVYEVGRHDGLPYMALEYVPGGTLAQHAPAPLPARTAATLAEQVARGVAHAHAHGVVHRDLKPENVLLCPAEAGGAPTPKVADFGLAKRMDLGPGLTASGAVMGTPSYMAPEQATGDAKHVGPPADVWALGAILYRLLTGGPPFASTNKADTIRQVIEAVPRSPRKLVPGLPRDLETICLKCLQKRPADRYPSAAELADDLRRWLDGQAVAARLPRTRARRRLVVLALVGLCAAGLAAGYAAFRGDEPPPAPPDSPAAVPDPGEQIEAVAILPFENVGKNADADFLCDGISESIIQSLSKVRSLKVRPFSSVSAFKGVSDPVDAGQKLKVQAVLTGRVVRQADRVVVTTELIDVRHNVTLWADRFNQPVTDVFALQETVARQISRTLKLRLGPDEEPAARRQPDPEAFQLYLKGRHFFNTGSTQAQTRKAIEAYQQAIAKDPDYAHPYMATAEAYYWLSNVFAAPAEVIPKAKAAAARAVHLDDTLGDAHALLGLFAALYDWDWPAADREFRRAVELSPGSASVHTYYALYLIATGRVDDVVATLRLAQERDPTSSFLSVYPAFALYLGGRFDEAARLLTIYLEANDKDFLPYAYMGLIHEQRGEYDKAVRSFDRAIELEKAGGNVAGNTEAVAQRGHILAVAGRKAEAEAVLNELLAIRDRYVSPYNIALLYAGLGDTDRAFEWLNKAVADHSEWLAYIRSDPRTMPLRADPRFQDILRQIKLAK